MGTTRIYIVEDEALIALEISDRLTKLGYAVCGTAARGEQAETARRTLNTRLDFLLSSSPATIYTCEAVPPYAATFISANLTGLLGYTAEEFLASQASGPIASTRKTATGSSPSCPACLHTESTCMNTGSSTRTAAGAGGERRCAWSQARTARPEN